MEHLDEEQLREMIKEEVVRKIAANALDEQIFDKIMSFLILFIPRKIELFDLRAIIN